MIYRMPYAMYDALTHSSEGKQYYRDKKEADNNILSYLQHTCGLKVTSIAVINKGDN